MRRSHQLFAQVVQFWLFCKDRGWLVSHFAKMRGCAGSGRAGDSTAGWLDFLPVRSIALGGQPRPGCAGGGWRGQRVAEISAGVMCRDVGIAWNALVCRSGLLPVVGLDDEPPGTAAAAAGHAGWPAAPWKRDVWEQNGDFLGRVVWSGNG